MKDIISLIDGNAVSFTYHDKQRLVVPTSFYNPMKYPDRTLMRGFELDSEQHKQFYLDEIIGEITMIPLLPNSNDTQVVYHLSDWHDSQPTFVMEMLPQMFVVKLPRRTWLDRFPLIKRGYETIVRIFRKVYSP